MDPKEYVAELIERLQRITSDPQKCAEVMAHDMRDDGCGLNSLCMGWEDEQWEREHPDEMEQLWANVDLKKSLKRLKKELKARRKESN